MIIRNVHGSEKNGNDGYEILLARMRIFNMTWGIEEWCSFCRCNFCLAKVVSLMCARARAHTHHSPPHTHTS